jgi:hypothetical protein
MTVGTREQRSPVCALPDVSLDAPCNCSKNGSRVFFVEVLICLSHWDGRPT